MKENEMVDFRDGQSVRVVPSANASPGLIEQVRKVEERLGVPVIGTVGAVFSDGACIVVLPTSMAIAGYSSRLNKETEYVRLTPEHLQAVP